MTRTKSEEKYKERFFSSFDKSENCWNWKKYIDSRGYGAFYYNGAPRKAHRMMWKYTNGDIPPGMIICHKCDNPICVNPDHLFIGTPLDNFMDAVKKGRIHPCGEKNPSAKLSNDDVLQIRSMYGRIISYGFLAKLFNVDKKQIINIVKRIQRTDI